MTVRDLSIAIIISLFVSLASAQEIGQVGPQTNGTYLVPTMQLIQPAGDSLTFNGRAIDLALSPDTNNVFVKYDQGVLVVDPETWKIRQQIGIGEGSSVHGIAVRRDGTRVYVTGNNNTLWDGDVSSAGSLTFTRKATLLGPGGRGLSNPCGVALSPDEKTALRLPLSQEQSGPCRSGI